MKNYIIIVKNRWLKRVLIQLFNYFSYRNIYSIGQLEDFKVLFKLSYCKYIIWDNYRRFITNKSRKWFACYKRFNKQMKVDCLGLDFHTSWFKVDRVRSRIDKSSSKEKKWNNFISRLKNNRIGVKKEYIF